MKGATGETGLKGTTGETGLKRLEPWIVVGHDVRLPADSLREVVDPGIGGGSVRFVQAEIAHGLYRRARGRCPRPGHDEGGSGADEHHGTDGESDGPLDPPMSRAVRLPDGSLSVRWGHGTLIPLPPERRNISSQRIRWATVRIGDEFLVVHEPGR